MEVEAFLVWERVALIEKQSMEQDLPGHKTWELAVIVSQLKHLELRSGSKHQRLFRICIPNVA